MQVLFGGEVDPSDKGHAGAGQFSNDTYSYEPSKVHFLLTSWRATGNFHAHVEDLQGLHHSSLCLH